MWCRWRYFVAVRSVRALAGYKRHVFGSLRDYASSFYFHRIAKTEDGATRLGTIVQLVILSLDQS